MFSYASVCLMLTVSVTAVECLDTTVSSERQALNPTMVPLVQHHRLLGFIAMMDEPIHHLQIKPWYPDLINTRFIIFDRENQHYDGVNGNFEYLTYLKFNASFLKRKANNYDKIYFITHGFQEFFMGDYVRLKDALLDFQATTNPAVIVVDWSDGSMYGRKMVNNAELDKTTYGQAAVNTMVVGREVGLLSYMLCVLEYTAREDIHYIGFDLGAHVMHFAGQWFSYLVDRIKERDSTPRRTGKVGRITGLDPSARDFQGYGTAAKLPYLSAVDADFVDIMHTSSVRNNGDNDDVKNHRLGMSALSGHVDVYPNGGQEQPFCNNKPKCSHRRALHYFIASLSNDVDIKMSLTAFGADSYQEYIAIKTGIPAPTSLMSMFKRKAKQTSFYSINFLGIKATVPDLQPTDYPRHGHFLEFGLDEDLSFVKVLPSVRSDVKFIDKLQSPIVTKEGFDFYKFPSHDVRKIKDIKVHELDRPGCGRFLAPPVSQARVHFGLDPYVRQFPWNVCMVNTLIIEGYEPFLHASCTGSLIEDDFVITAAHCFDSYARNKEGYPELRNDVPVYMSFGIDCKHPVATREVLVVQNVTVFIHPGYRKGAATGSVTDIALVKLEKPIQSFILPENGQFTNETKLNTVCWRNAKYFDHENTCELLYFAGYGSNDDVNKTVSEALRWTVLNILKFPSYEYVTDTVMYMGDSGGPFTQLVRTTGGPAQLYDQVSNYTAVLVSTLIGGSVPCIAQAQSSATRVGHPLVYSWIVDVLDNNVGPLKQELNYGPIRFDYKKYIRLM